ncbi:MAG: anaerobic ribonucleoside-triphosphate reductase [Pseudomonas sp.]|uniref:anaerobic ribonucleoside-triphosphate reductase n=1 Tax=Pseudomonas sp. TaxID=306 RepID=UPI003D0EB983
MTAQANLPTAQRQRCEVWTRVMGYHRPVAAFNPGKQSEHRERLHFNERAAMAGHS